MEAKPNQLIPLDSLNKANEALNFCSSVEVVKIQNNDQAENAGRLFKQLSAHIKTVEDERVKTKQPHLDNGKIVDAWFKDVSTPLASLKTKLDAAIREYQRVLEDKRRAEQERLNREAAERQRKLDEAAAAERTKAEELRRQAEAAGAEEAARLRAQAEKAEAKAEVKEQRSGMVIAPVAQVVAPSMAGMTVRTNWKCEITNPMEFVKWAFEHGMQNLICPNEKALGPWAKSIRKEMSGPGYRIFNNEKLGGCR